MKCLHMKTSPPFHPQDFFFLRMDKIIIQTVIIINNHGWYRVIYLWYFSDARKSKWYFDKLLNFVIILFYQSLCCDGKLFWTSENMELWKKVWHCFYLIALSFLFWMMYMKMKFLHSECKWSPFNSISFLDK